MRRSNFSPHENEWQKLSYERIPSSSVREPGARKSSETLTQLNKQIQRYDRNTSERIEKFPFKTYKCKRVFEISLGDAYSNGLGQNPSKAFSYGTRPITKKERKKFNGRIRADCLFHIKISGECEH